MANILLVEDDLDYANAVVKVMKSIGHSVETESDPSCALVRLKEKHPDLIILDVMFPEDSFAGLELARTLKSQAPEIRDIPVLLLTAVNQQYPVGFSTLDLDNSFFPVSDFLEKTADLDVVKNKVTKLLEESGRKKSGR